MVVCQYGIPEYIMSNYNPRFHVHLWDELMSLLDMALTFSMALHPQTNGMAEVINYTMEKLV